MAPPIVTRFLISLDQNKLIGAFVFLLCLGGAVVWAILPDPQTPATRYRTLGQLAFRVPPPAFTSTGTQLQEQGKVVDKDMLLSPWVLERVATKLQLTPEQMLEIRDKKLKIKFPGDGQTQEGDNKGGATQTAEPQVITLELTDVSKNKSELLLETMMKTMVDYSRWVNTSQLRARIEALGKRLANVQGDLTAAEEKFYRYISKEGSELLAIQDGSLFSAITSSQQQQRDLRLQLQGIQGQIGSLTKQLGLSPDQAYTSSALSADPIIANLRARILETDLQLDRLQKDLRPEHPTIVQLRKDQQVNENLLKQRAAEVIGKDGILVPLPSKIRQESNLDPTRQDLASQLVSLQTQKEGLIKQLESLVKQEKQLRTEYERYPDKQLKQARLVQAVEFQRVIYQNILTALVDAQSAEAETVGSLTVAQTPVSQTLAVLDGKKNRFLIVLGGLGLGTLAGLGTIFLLAVLDDRLHSADEINDSLGNREVLILGQLPLIPPPEKPILVDGHQEYLAYYERFRSNLRRLGTETSKVVIITSISGREGKSVTAYNLAIAASLAGRRTLLVEADLRSVSQAMAIGVNPDPESFREPLLYYGARSKSIRLAPDIENLSILPSPGPQRQAAAIIESSELQLLLKDARGRFDLVVVDTPSLSSCNDALLLEPLTDGIILVTRPGITKSSLLGEAIDQLEEAEVSVLGAVVNCAETATVSSPGENNINTVTVVNNDDISETEKVEVGSQK
ncbi:MAG: hypothetical protein N5P05_003048 [Chroococcopsis gigantea SAG 12.99]|jgi:succinoglycan biosynthesis transport protein ExoP|nr:P-loop NTPase [Chlorogloea purpurea SAG 13.99]MDV3001442.1 hypothetical protein [Chroococcopsis gigantea SAG 12.99]